MTSSLLRQGTQQHHVIDRHNFGQEDVVDSMEDVDDQEDSVDDQEDIVDDREDIVDDQEDIVDISKRNKYSMQSHMIKRSVVMEELAEVVADDEKLTDEEEEPEALNLHMDISDDDEMTAKPNNDHKRKSIRLQQKHTNEVVIEAGKERTQQIHSIASGMSQTKKELDQREQLIIDDVEVEKDKQDQSVDMPLVEESVDFESTFTSVRPRRALRSSMVESVESPADVMEKRVTQSVNALRRVLTPSTRQLRKTSVSEETSHIMTRSQVARSGNRGRKVRMRQETRFVILSMYRYPSWE